MTCFPWTNRHLNTASQNQSKNKKAEYFPLKLEDSIVTFWVFCPCNLLHPFPLLKQFNYNEIQAYFPACCKASFYCLQFKMHNPEWVWFSLEAYSFPCVLLLRTSKTGLQKKVSKNRFETPPPPPSSTDFILWLPLCVHVHVSTHSLWCEDQSVKAPKEFSCSCSAKILSPMYPDTNRSNTSLQTPTVKSWMCVVQEELQPESLGWVHVVQD